MTTRPQTGGLAIATVVAGLEHPWDIGFLPDGRILLTERPASRHTNRLYCAQDCYGAGGALVRRWGNPAEQPPAAGTQWCELVANASP